MSPIPAYISAATTSPTFWEASPSYNFANLFLAVFGIVLTIAGFLITIVQLVRTKRAADAAKEATESMREQFRALAAFLDLKSLGEYAAEVAMHLQHRNLAAANVRSQDLRNGVSRARALIETKRLLTQERWQETTNKIIEVQELATNGVYLKKNLTKEEHSSCVARMQEIADLFHQLSASVEADLQP